MPCAIFRHANSFLTEIIYHPVCGLWRSLVKPGNLCLALSISFFSLAVFPAASAQAPAAHKPQPQRHPSTLEGHWSGSLQAGEAVLHLVLHVSRATDGSLQATIDSLDQGVYGIEVTALTVKDSILHFNVASAGASYEGKFSAVHASIEGDWIQGSASLPLVFHRRRRSHRMASLRRLPRPGDERPAAGCGSRRKEAIRCDRRRRRSLARR